ncbi:MAG: type II secretion system F family protein [Victivallales bacterium]|nr:type II secretion system F family protein [Victivallales bacterium]
MAHYKYKAVEPGKAPVEIIIEADSEAKAVAALQHRGMMPIKNYGIVNGLGGEKKLFGLRGDKFDVYQFTDRLVPLLKAGIQLEKCLAIMEEGAAEGINREIIRALRRGLHEGKTFSSLIRGQGLYFPPIYANLIETGETTGCLPEVADELRRFVNESRDLREFIITSSIYPLIVLGVTFAVVIFLFTLVIPRFAKIFADMGRDLPLITEIMLNTGEIFLALWWIWPLALLALLFFCRNVRKGGAAKEWWDKFIIKTPLVGELVQRIQIGQFIRTLAIMMNNHVPILPAIRISIKVIANNEIAGSFSNVGDELRGGMKLSATLAQSSFMPQGSIPMLRIAEESGDTGEMLTRIAEECESKIKIRIKRLLAAMEPLIILVLGVIVLLVVFSIFLPILEMSNI